ncbi:hypothetical protein WEH80_19855 [Actinomycetes bacterium KLBMP 9759]
MAIGMLGRLAVAVLATVVVVAAALMVRPEPTRSVGSVPSTVPAVAPRAHLGG